MSRPYEKPEVREYGSIESRTQDLDKIGSADDGVEYSEGELDGTIQPD